MQYITFQKEIMKDIKIKQYEKVYFEYMINNLNLIEFLNNRNKSHITSQKGGGINRKFIYKFNNKKFKLFEQETKNGYDISIHVKDDINDPRTCLHIMIDKESHIACVQNISYYKECVKTNLEHPGGGSVLFKMCIKFLKDSKDKYHVQKIVLTDNSTFTCLKNREKISLAMFYTLLYGDTWYGKYGFRPYDANNNRNDIVGTKYYEQNKKIVRATLVRETNMIDYFHQMLDEDNPEKKEENKIKMNKYYQMNKNLTLNKFFRKIMMDFQDSCEIFCRFYRNFYHDMNLYNFRGETFYLDI